MSTTLTKPVLLNETGRSIVTKLDEIKDAVSLSGEYIPLAIRITTPPTKTSYIAGDRLDLSGIVVNLVGSNGSMIDVTSACTFSPTNGTVLHANNTSVTITYHYSKDNLDFTTSQSISVADLVSIEVTTPPTKVTYYDGDALDLTGIVVKVVADNGEKIDVTNQCVFSPANGSTVILSGGASEEQIINITYHWALENVDFTTTQTITVNWVYITALEILTPPTKTEYFVGETLDLTGLTARATFVNGTTAIYGPSDLGSIPSNGSVLNDTSVDTVYVFYTTGGLRKDDTQSITVINPVYGAEWDGTATSAWTRTDGAINFVDPVPAVDDGVGSSPFDNISPWKDIKRVEDATAGSLVEIPKYYFKWTKDGEKMKLQISPFQLNGFLVSPAHADRGDGQGERDKVYVGRYKCSSTNKSQTGQGPKVSTTRANFRTAIHNLGSDIWQQDFAMYWTIRMLYLVEFADWNSQRKIGSSNQQYSPYTRNTGKTDGMNYHTGRMLSGDSSDQYSRATQYRYMEDLWGNYGEYVDGIYFASSNCYCIKNPANFSDTSGGTNLGSLLINSTTGNSYPIKSWNMPNVSGFEYALYPASRSSSDLTTYCCDDYGVTSSHKVLRTGNNTTGPDDGAGLFCFWGVDSSSALTYVTSRLMKLPANT